MISLGGLEVEGDTYDSLGVVIVSLRSAYNPIREIQMQWLWRSETSHFEDAHDAGDVLLRQPPRKAGT